MAVSEQNFPQIAFISVFLYRGLCILVSGLKWNYMLELVISFTAAKVLKSGLNPFASRKYCCLSFLGLSRDLAE